MKYPIIFLLLSLFTLASFSQNSIDKLIDNCQYPEAFKEIAKQPNTLENKYFKAKLLLHFGALELSKNQCYQVLHFTKEPLILAKTYQLLFDISYYLTDLEAERKYADSSYYFYKKIYGDNSIYKAQYNINLCRYYNYFRRNDLSKVLSIEALDISRKFKKDRYKIDLPMVYGQYYASFRNDPLRGNFDSAQIYCDSALYLHKEIYNGVENFNKIKLYHLKGLVYLDRNTLMTSLGKWDEGMKYLSMAKKYFEYANGIVTKNIGNNHVLLSYGNSLIGLLYLQQKVYDKATNYLNLAENNLYPNIQSRNYMAAFTVNMMGIYDWQNNCSYSLYYDSGKLYFLNQALQTARKSEIIYDLLLEEGKNLNDYYSHIPYQKLAAIYYELYQQTKKATYLDSSFYYAEKEKIADLIIKKQIALKLQNNNLSAIQKEKEYVDQEILRKNNYSEEIGLYKISKPKRPNQDVFKQIKSIKELQRDLKDNSTAIILLSHYNLPVRFPPMVTCHIITKNEYRHTSFTMAQNIDLKDPIEDLMGSLVGNDLKAFKKASYTIYKELFLPWKRLIPQNIKSLQICPVNKFRNFPFEVLIEDTLKQSFLDQPYLIKKFAISYLISPSYTNLHSTLLPNDKIYVFNPDFSSSDKAELPFNQKCSKWIATTFDKAIVPAHTHKQDLKKCLNEGNTIHLATHAVGFDDYTNTGRIYTSDSPFYLNELYDMNLQQNPFVVLTCCEADKGNLQFNVGNDNFSRAFSFAGASAVLSTLWSIDDQASAELMKHFYENLASGMDKSTALQQAKLSILRDSNLQTQAPFYWAASVLTGDQAPLEFYTKPFRFGCIILIAFAISIASLFILSRFLF